jgi:3',5'-cyclic AMP phosphodiesterase CpdA
MVLAVGLSAVAAAAEKAPEAPAAKGEFKPFTFLHFGDPQIGFGRDGIAADKQRFLAAIAQANEQKPAFVYLAGDLVHDRTKAEYAAFDEALKAFRVPVKITPGNHDVVDPATLKGYRAKYGRDYYTFTHNNCDFLFVNSMLLSTAAPWFKPRDAKFTEEVGAQWKWLEAALAAARANDRTHVFLLTHVPPFLRSETEKASYGNLPPDARKRLLALARKHGVRAILVGHAHRTREIRAGKVTIYITGGTARVSDKLGFGFRAFTVHADRIEQKFVPLKSAGAAAPPPRATATGKKP